MFLVQKSLNDLVKRLGATFAPCLPLETALLFAEVSENKKARLTHLAEVVFAHSHGQNVRVVNAFDWTCLFPRFPIPFDRSSRNVTVGWLPEESSVRLPGEKQGTDYLDPLDEESTRKSNSPFPSRVLLQAPEKVPLSRQWFCILFTSSSYWVIGSVHLSFDLVSSKSTIKSTIQSRMDTRFVSLADLFTASHFTTWGVSPAVQNVVSARSQAELQLAFEKLCQVQFSSVRHSTPKRQLVARAAPYVATEKRFFAMKKEGLFCHDSPIRVGWTSYWRDQDNETVFDLVGDFRLDENAGRPLFCYVYQSEGREFLWVLFLGVVSFLTSDLVDLLDLDLGQRSEKRDGVDAKAMTVSDAILECVLTKQKEEKESRLLPVDAFFWRPHDVRVAVDVLWNQLVSKATKPLFRLTMEEKNGFGNLFLVPIDGSRLDWASDRVSLVTVGGASREEPVKETKQETKQGTKQGMAKEDEEEIEKCLLETTEVPIGEIIEEIIEETIEETSQETFEETFEETLKETVLNLVWTDTDPGFRLPLKAFCNWLETQLTQLKQESTLVNQIQVNGMTLRHHQISIDQETVSKALFFCAENNKCPTPLPLGQTEHMEQIVPTGKSVFLGARLTQQERYGSDEICSLLLQRHDGVCLTIPSLTKDEPHSSSGHDSGHDSGHEYVLSCCSSSATLTSTCVCTQLPRMTRSAIRSVQVTNNDVWIHTDTTSSYWDKIGKCRRVLSVDFDPRESLFTTTKKLVWRNFWVCYGSHPLQVERYTRFRHKLTVRTFSQHQQGDNRDSEKVFGWVCEQDLVNLSLSQDEEFLVIGLCDAQGFSERKISHSMMSQLVTC